MRRFLILAILSVGLCHAQRRVQDQYQGQRQQDQDQNQQDQYQEPPQVKQQPLLGRRQQDEFQERPQQRQYSPEPQQRSRESTTYIPIIRFDKEQGEDGSYKAAWETGNNIIAQEEGFIKDLGLDPDSKEGEHLNAQVQQGSYTYTSPDGQIITVNYIADETGFHPTGDHLPTPPPVSPEVQKGLDLIYAGIRLQQEVSDRESRERPLNDNRQQDGQDGQQGQRQPQPFAPNRQQNYQENRSSRR